MHRNGEYNQHVRTSGSTRQNNKVENSHLVNTIENDFRFQSERRQVLQQCTENMKDLDPGEYRFKFKHKKV